MAHGTLSREASTNLETPGAALAIGAHPDDVEFGCGATLAKWASRGCRIRHLVCTDGSKGTWDAEADTARLVALREQEQREASRRLGGDGEVIFLRRVDGELQSDLKLRGEVALWIRRFRPDVVLGHDPWKRYRLHPDHRNAGFAATDGIVAARDPHFFPEHHLPPHRPSALLLWEADEPDHAEDIRGFDQVKLHALMAHRSQFRSTMKIAWARADGETDDDQLRAFKERLDHRHREAGSAFGWQQAEAFKLLTNL
jgi:LmbE family N-acetylglucosaminyl deacetylase